MENNPVKRVVKIMQKEIQQHSEDIKVLFGHAKIANEEMGVVKIQITEINGKIDNITDHITWIKQVYEGWEKKIDKIDERVWWILGTIILGFITTIYFSSK